MTAGQSASLSWSPWPDLFFCLTTVGFLRWGTLSDERMGLQFTVQLCLSSHSRVQVLHNSRPYFSFSFEISTNLANNNKLKSKSKLYYYQWSVGQSVLVSATHLGPGTNFYPSFNYFFRQLWICWCGASSLSWAHFIVSVLEIPQPGGPGSCIYFSHEQGSSVIPPGIGLV
jgi:hypothetical protein